MQFWVDVCLNVAIAGGVMGVPGLFVWAALWNGGTTRCEKVLRRISRTATFYGLGLSIVALIFWLLVQIIWWLHSNL